MDADPFQEAAGKQPRKLERRKRRRSRRKQSALQETEVRLTRSARESEAFEAADFLPSTELDLEDQIPEQTTTIFSHSVDLSPRRKALMRHKTSSELNREPSFVSEVKEIRKSRKSAASVDALDGKYSLILSSQSMEEKACLFTYPVSRIVSFREQLSESPSRVSIGALLAHGEFEIFQLHGGDVTYLACGKSFVYPLLPRLKILRTSSKEFVLPLVNPERYWKIYIDSPKQHVLSELETVLKRVVVYTNLSLPGPPPLNVPLSASTKINTFTGTHAGHVTGEPDLTDTTKSNPIIQNYPFHNDIHESPHSVPHSPCQGDLCMNPLLLSAPEPPIEYGASNSLPSITSAVASFELDSLVTFGETVLKQDSIGDLSSSKPHVLANPYYVDDAVVRENVQHTDQISKQPRKSNSETSSMDSLLDEYEETISVSKSVQYNSFRTPSRTTSHISPAYSSTRSATVYLHTPQYLSHMNGYKDLSYPLRRTAQGSQIDGFPTISLPRYNRQRQNSIGGPSRQSSVSDLYSSTSNWMEPGKAPYTKKLPSLISTHSLTNNVFKSEAMTSLNDTYREIYKSLSQHNTSHSSHEKLGPTGVLHKPPQTAKMGNGTPSENPSTGHPRGKTSRFYGSQNESTRDAPVNLKAAKDDTLSSVDVFKLVSERNNCKQKSPPATRFRRLFGW